MVSSALLGAALVGLALRILSLPDEAWARWQPLPDARIRGYVFLFFRTGSSGV